MKLYCEIKGYPYGKPTFIVCENRLNVLKEANASSTTHTKNIYPLRIYKNSKNFKENS